MFFQLKKYSFTGILNIVGDYKKGGFMEGINVKSEIGTLKKVLLHRPGNELLNLTPDTLSRLLFDDIPFLPEAQKEHDEFAHILKENGIEVVYLEDLMAEVLELGDDIENKFIEKVKSDCNNSVT